MRRLIIILFVACIFLLSIAIFIKPLIIALARKQLGHVFIQSQVSISRCALHPARQLSLFDIEVKKQGAYDIRFKEASIRYNLFSILKAGSLNLSLKGGSISVNTPKQGVGEFSAYLNLDRGKPIFGHIEISDLRLDLNTLDLTAKGTFSSELNLARQSLDYLDFKMEFFKMLGVQAENAFLKLGHVSGEGDFNIAQLKYDKLIVNDIRGRVKLTNRVLSLYGDSAKFLDGDLKGDLDATIDKESQYLLTLKCANLDIEKLVQDLNLGEKFDMTGRINGYLKLRGKGANIETLEGEFSTLESGGKLVIKDTKFLENMARNTQQPLDLLVESFKNYHYNTGVMSLGFIEGNVVLKVGLEGETGKRNLNVIVHDARLGKEGQ